MAENPNNEFRLEPETKYVCLGPDLTRGIRDESL